MSKVRSSYRRSPDGARLRFESRSGEYRIVCNTKLQIAEVGTVFNLGSKFMRVKWRFPLPNEEKIPEKITLRCSS